ncbi:mitogen-activated protein kinase kinase kinase 7-interacting protein 3 homolog [Acanthaster planci]|uniref:Mitogen-activated protein kinase kinase kinase 7-interacting protein 3 homolog n=1 Tax=Acanthaster planci TaxID=133434 RepID=A0A8B7YZK4_ACAPL|nr:mitogen-activated protein kinase kinase kinase 7-interacting protein 3 homolog [Acanthaster planci]
MAIARDKELFIGDELSASSLRDLQLRFPEIPTDVVSSFLKKNGGNMSRCIEELEHASPSYMYGEFVSHDTPAHEDQMTQNTPPRTRVGAAAYPSQFYSPERGVPVHAPNTDLYYPQGFHHMRVEDPERTPQPSYTSWASLETGVPGLEMPVETRQNPLSVAAEQRHVTSCTLDIQKPPLRTVSAPNAEIGQSGSPVPVGSRYAEGDALLRQSSHASSLYGRTTANGLEQRMDPKDFPFEPRPSWQEDPQPFAMAGHEAVGDRWMPSQPKVRPTESGSGIQIATSYQLDPLQPSSPATKPRKGKPSPSSSAVASYSKATEKISFNPNLSRTPAQEPLRASSMPNDGAAAHQTAANLSGTSLGGGEPDPPKRKERSKRKDANLAPPSLQQERSASKEKEDQAYTEALIMHQRARYERLSKELEDERKSLAFMRDETSHMENEVTLKRKNHRAPFPTPEEIGKLREQKHQLQIDIECMTREIESYKSQGLMDVAKATSFYGNIGSTGAPGPVPPIVSQSNAIPENITQIDTEVPPPPYESLMWSCSACTLLNHPDLDKCECCEMPRDK